MGGNQAEERSLERSLSLLDDFLAALPATLGFTPGTLVLGGFSQGGTMSIAFALSRPGRVTVALNFSGFVAAALDLPTGVEAEAATPIFWGHGMSDPAIPFGMAVSGRAALLEAGVPLVSLDYPVGHQITPEEVRDAVTMVRSVAGPVA
jgi:phospholipase/carboxylesterase